MLESFHDAQQWLDTAITLFSTGHLSLEERGTAENLFWAICRRIRNMIDGMEYVPEELDTARSPAVRYLLLQLLAVSVAARQLGDQAAVSRAADSSTGRAADTVGHAGRHHLRLGRQRSISSLIGATSNGRCRCIRLNDEPYVLGAFLIGAYQEILGDLHNLFGDTNAVHVNLTETGEVVLESMIKGDTVTEVLNYVQFHRRELMDRLQAAVERAVQQGRLENSEAGRCMKFYEDALNGYTYLEDESP